MDKTVKRSLIYFSFIFLLGCGSTKETNDTKPPLNEEITGELELADRSKVDPTASDEFGISNAKLEGDTLEVQVSYGGGCGEADFQLYWNGAMMKSMPPQVNLWVHLVDEDSCEALLQKTLRFDISSLLENQKEVVLRLKHYPVRFTYSKQ